jgi:ATP-dependent DNA helicase RecQ
LLNKEGFGSCYYHAGIDEASKAKNYDAWMSNKVKIMVATTAFGMGIDKGDVRWVIHWDVPDTLEGYYQEIGRAGRNGAESKTYLLYNQRDFERLNQSIEELPDIKGVEDFYRLFCSKHQIAVGAGLGLKVSFSIVELAEKMDLSIPTLLSYIQLIQRRKLWQFIESEQSVPQIQFHSIPAQWEHLRIDWKEILTALYRLYPNAVDAPHRIDRKRFAAMAQVTPKEFESILSSLTTKGLITYLPEKSNSAIVLTEPRPMNKHMRFPKSFVDAYITSKSERTGAMLDFLENNHCLNNQIATYFGQDNQGKCGTCSTCTHNHYPDEHLVKKMLSEGLSFDDIWFDLNCNPDALRK